MFKDVIVLISFNILSTGSHKLEQSAACFIQLTYLLLISCLFIPTIAAALNKYDQGAFYFAQGDYTSALSFWAPLAKQGNSAAQYSIGLLYEQGKGVKKDSQRALQYFQLASAQNLPVAQYYLGMKYFAGLGVKKDIHKARRLLTRAAESDYLMAQFQLANIYDKGNGKKRDLALSTQWFTRAAENGYGPAQHSLATRFLTGRGTSLDLHQGIFWLEKAAEQNDYDAMRDLGYMYFKGMGVDKNFQQAHDILIMPAEEGSGLAMFLLGEIYSSGGFGINKNLHQAKKWYQLAKNSGYKKAQEKLHQLNNNNSNSIIAIKTQPKKTPLAIKKTRLTQDALRFKQLNDKFYLLQILVAKQYNSITQLTDQYIDEKTYFLKINKNNENFYLLIYGYYQNYTEAKKAINQLPDKFQLKTAPWIRQVKHIKASVL